MREFNAAFWKWFGESKVVGKDGKPLVVHHGTNAEFYKFDKAKIGSTFEVDQDVGFFFTNNKSLAADYADAAYIISKSRRQQGSPRVVSAYLSIKNPWVIYVDTDKKSPIAHFEGGEGVFDVGQTRVVQYAVDSGYDGIIVRDARGINSKYEALFIVFDPTQIKSVENDGTYDSDDADIRSNPDYSGEHEAPAKEDGAPLWDVTLNGMYPKDIYDHTAEKYYPHYGDRRDGEAIRIIQWAHNKNNNPITIYRAVPGDLVRPKINPGDWVTIVRGYAKEHGEDNLGGDYKIISKSAHVRDLFTDANSIFEFGYDPQPWDQEHTDRRRARRMARLAVESPSLESQAEKILRGLF